MIIGLMNSLELTTKAGSMKKTVEEGVSNIKAACFVKTRR